MVVYVCVYACVSVCVPVCACVCVSALLSSVAVCGVCRDGIRFATQGLDRGDLTNLSFLEILSEFSFKLLQSERKQL